MELEAVFKEVLKESIGYEVLGTSDILWAFNKAILYIAVKDGHRYYIVKTIVDLDTDLKAISGTTYIGNIFRVSKKDVSNALEGNEPKNSKEDAISNVSWKDDVLDIAKDKLESYKVIEKTFNSNSSFTHDEVASEGEEDLGGLSFGSPSWINLFY